MIENSFLLPPPTLLRFGRRADKNSVNEGDPRRGIVPDSKIINLNGSSDNVFSVGADPVRVCFIISLSLSPFGAECVNRERSGTTDSIHLKHCAQIICLSVFMKKSKGRTRRDEGKKACRSFYHFGECLSVKEIIGFETRDARVLENGEGG